MRPSKYFSLSLYVVKLQVFCASPMSINDGKFMLPNRDRYDFLRVRAVLRSPALIKRKFLVCLGCLNIIEPWKSGHLISNILRSEKEKKLYIG